MTSQLLEGVESYFFSDTARCVDGYTETKCSTCATGFYNVACGSSVEQTNTLLNIFFALGSVAAAMGPLYMSPCVSCCRVSD